MKFSTKILSTSAFSACLVLGIAGGLSPAHAEATRATIQSEQKAHPQLVAAIRNLEVALKHLNAAPDDFGGYKSAAIKDCVGAIHSLKRALYYRLKLDDAALDRAE
jgi:hypothetical protein